MSDPSVTIAYILVTVVGFSSLVVAFVLIIIGTIVRRVLLRIEQMVVEVDDAGMRMVGESERLMALARTSGPFMLRLASALAGVLLARHFVRAAHPKKHVRHEKK